MRVSYVVTETSVFYADVEATDETDAIAQLKQRGETERWEDIGTWAQTVASELVPDSFAVAP